jgi:hypothetical protein
MSSFVVEAGSGSDNNNGDIGCVEDRVRTKYDEDSSNYYDCDYVDPTDANTHNNHEDCANNIGTVVVSIPPINGKISPDLDVLAILSAKYPWLPNSGTCRPNPVQLAEKNLLRRTLLNEWRTKIDFIAHTVFGCEWRYTEGETSAVSVEDSGRDTDVDSLDGTDAKGREVDDNNTAEDTDHVRKVSDTNSTTLMRQKMTSCDFEGMIKFVPCDFPYQIHESGHHYVLWYGSPVPVAEDVVNRDIRAAIQDIVGPETPYLFAWYINPKQTIPDIFHVQVFWTTDVDCS